MIVYRLNYVENEPLKEYWHNISEYSFFFFLLYVKVLDFQIPENTLTSLREP